MNKISKLPCNLFIFETHLANVSSFTHSYFPLSYWLWTSFEAPVGKPKKNEKSKFPSPRHFEIFSDFLKKKISKFVKNRNTRTSATTSVENDRIRARTIV